MIMKKLWPILWKVLWALSSATAYALPLGNPTEPRLFRSRGACCSCFDLWPIERVGFGYYGDFVFDRYMGNRLPADIYRTELRTDAAFLVVNLCNRLDIFSTLGTTKISLISFGSALSATTDTPDAFIDRYRDHVESKAKFSWSLGARATLYRYGCFGIGAEGQYFRNSSELDFFRDPHRVVVYPKGVPMKYSEWQIGAGAYYDLKLKGSLITSAVPYVGVKGSRATLDMNNSVIVGLPSATTTATLYNLRSRRKIGFAYGISTIFAHQLGLTVEGRVGDERGLYVNGQLRF